MIPIIFHILADTVQLAAESGAGPAMTNDEALAIALDIISIPTDANKFTLEERTEVWTKVCNIKSVLNIIKRSDENEKEYRYVTDCVHYLSFVCKHS